MMKQFDIIKEQIDRIIDQQERERWIEAVGGLLQKAIEAGGSRFIGTQNVPDIFEAECTRLSPAFEECRDGSCREKIIELWREHRDEIASILYCPVEDPKTGECFGVIIFWGGVARESEVEEMVPLKSGSKTIGVTVKKKKVLIPEKLFSYDDLYLVAQSYIYMFDRIERKATEELLAMPEKNPSEKKTRGEEKTPEDTAHQTPNKRGLFETIKRLIIPGKDKH